MIANKTVSCVDCLHAGKPEGIVAPCKVLGVGRVYKSKRVCRYFTSKYNREKKK